MQVFKNQWRIPVLLFVVSLITVGWSILYFSNIAKESTMPTAHEYPAQSGTMSGEYALLTINLVEQGVFSESTTTPFVSNMWRTPGYPAFIASLYAFFDSFYPILIAQIVLLFLTVLMIFSMAKRMMGEGWALALALVYLCLPDTVLSASTLLSENLFVFLFISALYLCFFSTSKLYARFALAGLLLALATYVRPASLYLPIFFVPAYLLLYVGWSKISRTHVLAVALLLLIYIGTLVPWCIRNENQLGSFAFASTGPYVLFRQNATQFYEAYNHIPNLDARYTLEDRAGIPRGPVPMDPAYSAVMQKVAVQVIAEHPFRYTLFHLTTFIPFFTSSGANDYWVFANGMSPDFNRPPEPSLIQALHPFSPSTLKIVLENHGWSLVENLAWALLTFLMCIGLWRSKNTRLAWMFFALIFYFALVTGPIAHARYRMPVDSLILLIAFSAAAYLWENRKTPRSGMERYRS